MQLLAPDIVAEARELSLPVLVAGLALGLFLWVLGGRLHRFWLVLGTTLVAGVMGLYSGATFGVQPLVAGLLLAIAAGALALSLIRVVAFAAGGVTGWVVLHAVAPSWNEPLVTFLAGGLLGLMLFRLWMMVLTSLGGTLLVGYSGLCLADQLGNLDAVTWCRERVSLLNIACGGVLLLGMLFQFLIDRRQIRLALEKADKEREKAAKEREKKAATPPKKRSWLMTLVQVGNYRQAG
jgi:hypothetical protein